MTSKYPTRNASGLLFAFCVSTFAFGAAGCQQKMAEQPYYRPYEQGDPAVNGPNGQTARPLEFGTMHRHQPAEDEPVAAWLTPVGRKFGADSKVSGADAYDPRNSGPGPGAPSRDPRSGKPDDKLFVEEFPFEITEGDMKRGQGLYQAVCAVCHGASGHGNGKIPERGLLRPPSYHTDPAGKELDWSTLSPDPDRVPEGQPPAAAGNGPEPNKGKLVSPGVPMGYSRGYYRWGIKIPLKEVPVGYIYQVIAWGYGGMGSYEYQVPNPADRWRIIAYVRALQYSQQAPPDDLPAGGRERLSKSEGTK